MLIIGFDLGLTSANPIGYFVMEYPDEIVKAYGTIPLTYKETWSKRIGEFAPKADDLISRHAPDLIAYELPFFMPRNPQTAIKLAHLGGAVIALASLRRIPFVGISATQAKKALFGKGKASKEEMIGAAHRRWNVEADSHESDAGAVGLAGFREATRSAQEERGTP